ncbi:hydroxymethylbilane synthase [Hyphococcus luteus]|uniref:Porphobilinogen deaminase n=1 Tax=Hyphococcus luteus TaxID=2058213 RepID=A0A2S7K6B1_9PROT|nr:hydroxymethylbilane synthase [Marinicaulis flavus]PQA88055.1 hydroxymethylbilane synthase [Marinicaulis flavus]
MDRKLRKDARPRAALSCAKTHIPKAKRVPEDKSFAIASRRSPLAMAQARIVQSMVAKAAAIAPDAAPVRAYISSGDKNLTSSLAEIGGKGLFTKEIEEALLSGDARFAVHSMKDMPAESPPGLVTAAIPPREDPRDAFISYVAETPWDLPPGARVGTASVRRAAQLLARRPDLKPVTLRGNVGTRIDKLERGEAEATFLALAGLNRLNFEDHVTTLMATDEMLPAVGQGALCVQAREDDEEARAIAASFNCPKTSACVAIERAFLAGLDGSCRTPIAGLAVIDSGEIVFRGEVLSLDGTERYGVERRLAYFENCENDAAKHGADAAAEVKAAAGEEFFRKLAQ